MKRMEAATLVLGAVCLGLSIALIDWRVAIGVAGVILIASSIDIRKRI